MPPIFSDAVDSRLSRDRPSSVGVSGRVALWLLGLFAIALLIRFTNLAAKPAWMDEVATTLFSLGNYSRLIPLNEIISLDQVLRPLQITPGASASDVVTHLLIEDNHPPTYFVLAHWWMALFQGITGRPEGVASLWAARALPAFFGALAVPATYFLAWVSFRDRLTSLLCALLMAVSPFGIFMAQEARHYSLAILAVIASLSCFVLAIKALQQRTPPSWGVVITWIVVNTLGLTIHFFCGLTLLAEGLTLLVMLIQQSRTQSKTQGRTQQNRPAWRTATWSRVYVAAAGTLAGALLWLPILVNFYGSPQTSFLKSGAKSWQFWINPIVQSLASWLYAVLSPVTRGYGTLAVIVIVTSCILLLGIYAPWLLAALQRALKFQLRQPPLRTGIQAMGGFFIMANGLFLIICYSLGFDITRGHRYSFVFFPSILMLLGVGLAPFWQGSAGESSNFNRVKLPFIQKTISGKAFVATVIGISFIGTQIIVNNFSNLKFYSADRLVNLIQATSTLPVVVGTDTKITEQPSVIGIEIMSVAWEIQRNFNPDGSKPYSGGPGSTEQQWVSSPQFIIAENNESKGIKAEIQLAQKISTLPRPFDLWLLNMSPDLTAEGCVMPTGGGANKGSFNYVHYQCDGAAQSQNPSS